MIEQWLIDGLDQQLSMLVMLDIHVNHDQTISQLHHHRQLHVALVLAGLLVICNQVTII